MVDLRTDVGALAFRNPLLLASGIWGESGQSLIGAYEAGAGAVVSKSIGAEPRPGYPNPTVEQYSDWGFLNAMGLPNPGIEAYPEEIRRARAGGSPSSVASSPLPRKDSPNLPAPWNRRASARSSSI
ncbi:MAG: hypothetical protein L3K11_07910 [Thermoplasmata archaeon]|nr:hypothetical protein [Thermoplasmata archaeon]